MIESEKCSIEWKKKKNNIARTAWIFIKVNHKQNQTTLFRDAHAKLFKEGTQRYQHRLWLSLGGGQRGGMGVHRGGLRSTGHVLVLSLVGGVTDTHYFAQKLRYTAYILMHMYILYTLCIFNVSNFT